MLQDKPKKPKFDVPKSLYPPQPPAAVAAMEDEFTTFINDPERKARRLKESLEPDPRL